jgi:hypothetical protein
MTKYTAEQKVQVINEAYTVHFPAVQTWFNDNTAQGVRVKQTRQVRGFIKRCRVWYREGALHQEKIDEFETVGITFTMTESRLVSTEPVVDDGTLRHDELTLIQIKMQKRFNDEFPALQEWYNSVPRRRQTARIKSFLQKIRTAFKAGILNLGIITAFQTLGINIAPQNVIDDAAHIDDDEESILGDNFIREFRTLDGIETDFDEQFPALEEWFDSGERAATRPRETTAFLRRFRKIHLLLDDEKREEFARVGVHFDWISVMIKRLKANRDEDGDWIPRRKGEADAKREKLSHFELKLYYSYYQTAGIHESLKLVGFTEAHRQLTRDVGYLPERDEYWKDRVLGFVGTLEVVGDLGDLNIAQIRDGVCKAGIPVTVFMEGKFPTGHDSRYQNPANTLAVVGNPVVWCLKSFVTTVFKERGHALADRENKAYKDVTFREMRYSLGKTMSIWKLYEWLCEFFDITVVFNQAKKTRLVYSVWNRSRCAVDEWYKFIHHFRRLQKRRLKTLLERAEGDDLLVLTDLSTLCTFDRIGVNACSKVESDALFLWIKEGYRKDWARFERDIWEREEHPRTVTYTELDHMKPLAGVTIMVERNEWDRKEALLALFSVFNLDPTLGKRNRVKSSKWIYFCYFEDGRWYFRCTDGVYRCISELTDQHTLWEDWTVEKKDYHLMVSCSQEKANENWIIFCEHGRRDHNDFYAHMDVNPTDVGDEFVDDIVDHGDDVEQEIDDDDSDDENWQEFG